MTTQGSARRNYNNHPFPGRTGAVDFALAHNGVLYNDVALRDSLHLPKTKIQTDSYIAVQLLQRQNRLDFSSLRNMAEQVSGSFTFTVLDGADNLYFVKGDNPYVSTTIQMQSFWSMPPQRQFCAVVSGC